MKYFDQHVHSEYSFDSKAKLEEYIKKAEEIGLSYFVMTDHTDFDFLEVGNNLVFDLEERHQRTLELQNKYSNIKLLEGIELGYTPQNLDKINKITKYKHFSIINLSIHTFDLESFYNYKHYEDDPTIIINKYLDLVYEAINSGVDFDVLSHVDYAYKVAIQVDSELKFSHFEESLKRIFVRLIELNKCLELNTKCQSGIKNDNHTRYLLTLYKSLGGVNLTVSSDAHEVNNLCLEFKKYIALTKECGFDHLCYFIDRKRYNFEI